MYKFQLMCAEHFNTKKYIVIVPNQKKKSKGQRLWCSHGRLITEIKKRSTRLTKCVFMYEEGPPTF